jgi:hypothetical protein
MKRRDVLAVAVSMRPMRARFRDLAAVALPLALAGCGSGMGTGDDVHPVCPTYQACGGDLVGSWRIVEDCSSGADPGFGSKECSVTSWQTEVSEGTWTFNADHTYAQDLISTTKLTIDAPLSCPGSGGGGGSFDPLPDGAAAPGPSAPLTCQDLERGMRANLSTPFAAVSCSAHGDRCACTRVFKPSSHSAHGTYAASGVNLQLEGEAPARYCVKGDELFVRSTRLVRLR